MAGAFLRLSRFEFLVGGLLGGALGTAVYRFEGGAIDWGAYALAQLTVSALHLMTHYTNDYFDRASDTLAERTRFSGGSGALVDGSLTPVVALVAALACLSVGLAGAAALVATGRTLAGGLALTVAVLAWTYSAPPVRLLARGLGEFDTALVVGVLVPVCTYAAQRGAVTLLAVAACAPATVAMFVMMLAVEVPDERPDAQTGKRNLVVRLGTDGIARLAGWAPVALIGAVGLALAAGAPATLAVLLLPSLVTGFGFAATLRSGAWSVPGGGAEIAARGVLFFVVVSLGSLLGFASALP